MVNSSHKIFLNRRRGISTIVGGIIFLVLLTAGFSTFFVAMDVQSDTINAQRTISNSIIEKTQEQFSIAAVTDDSNPWHLLDIQVKNEGTNPIQISNIWIINKTQPGQPAKSIPIRSSDAYIPAGYGLSILENQRLTIDPSLIPGDSDLYDIKVVSTLGTIKQTEINVGGNNYLLAELFTIPPDVAHNENVTLALRVTNVGPSEITGITPDLDFNILGIAPAGADAWLSTPEPILPVVSPVDLKPSETTIFSWTATLNTVGVFGDKIKFSNSATGTESTTGFTVTSNTASDKLVIRDPTGGAGNPGEEIIIKNVLFGKPEIFMIFPGPSGKDGSALESKGLWGVMVANPTDQPMDVSKVAILAYSPKVSSSDKIFKDICHLESNEHEPDTVAPTVDNWTCPKENQLVWSDVANPVRIQPRSVHPFMVKIGVDTFSTGPGDTGNALIHPIVWTSLGQFGKASYATTIHEKNIAMPNVFLSKVSSSSSAANSGNLLGNITRIPEGTPVVFNATLVDMSKIDGWEIKAGTKLIINVPKEWTFSHIASSSGFTMQPVQTYPDGSTQIVGVLNTDIDNPSDAKVVKFYATAPAVASTKMYVMHILADGTATGEDGTFAVGPLAEVVLQVCPSSGICVPP